MFHLIGDSRRPPRRSTKDLCPRRLLLHRALATAALCHDHATVRLLSMEDVDHRSPPLDRLCTVLEPPIGTSAARTSRRRPRARPRQSTVDADRCHARAAEAERLPRRHTDRAALLHPRHGERLHPRSCYCTWMRSAGLDPFLRHAIKPSCRMRSDPKEESTSTKEEVPPNNYIDEKRLIPRLPRQRRCHGSTFS